MPKRPAPLFLARKSYHRRRMMDAARLLPLAGIFFILMPILWQPRETLEPDTVFGLVYLFVVWTLLIIIARIVSQMLSSPPEETGDGPDSGDDAA